VLIVVYFFSGLALAYLGMSICSGSTAAEVMQGGLKTKIMMFGTKVASNPDLSVHIFGRFIAENAGVIAYIFMAFWVCFIAIVKCLMIWLQSLLYLNGGWAVIKAIFWAPAIFAYCFALYLKVTSTPMFDTLVGQYWLEILLIYLGGFVNFTVWFGLFGLCP
jgi:hypothetical protein